VLEVARTGAPGEAQGLAARAAPDTHAGVLVLGGDGTLNEVVQDLARRAPHARPRLAVIPSGTGDSLARDLGLPTPADALAALRAGGTRLIDLARVEVDGEEVFCFSVVGWGAIARINRRAERMRWVRGRRYDVAAAVEVVRPGPLASSGAVRAGEREDLLLAAACLPRHTGRGMLLAPDAELDDGLVDLVEVRRGGRLRLARLLAGVFTGDHVRSDLVSISRVSRLSLDLDPGSHVVLDGEAVPARRLTLEVQPRALEVVAPPKV